MAKRRRNSTSRKVRRDTRSIANRRLPHDPLVDALLYSSPLPPKGFQYDLEDILSTDGRLYHPAKHDLNRPSGKYVSFTSAPRNNPRSFHEVPSAVAFASPRTTDICVRRSVRREVIHATKKAGRVGQKRPKMNKFSDILC